MALGVKSERFNYGPRAWRKLRSRKVRRGQDTAAESEGLRYEPPYSRESEDAHQKVMAYFARKTKRGA